MSIVDEDTQRLPIVSMDNNEESGTSPWKDFARDHGVAAIIYMTRHYDERLKDAEIRPGYYVVEALERDDQGRVVRFGRNCACHDSVEASQFCLDRWAGRYVGGEDIETSEVLQCYSLLLQKGLVPLPPAEKEKKEKQRHAV